MGTNGILFPVRRWVYLLPFFHLCSCLVIGLARWDAAWGYLFFIDLPFSVVILAIAYNFQHPLVLFGILGTLWWYFVSCAAAMIYRGVIQRRPAK
jgi:hypothetical protein